jgi:hypothetical protein
VRKLIYSMNATLDGNIAARDDDIGWSAHWSTADQQPDATPVEVDFARVWQKTKNVVFSTTLTERAWSPGDPVARSPERHPGWTRWKRRARRWAGRRHSQRRQRPRPGLWRQGQRHLPER